MARKTLNLGILAHVDAGKTTLTERLLFSSGVIGEPGSVDKGTTQTDSLALEQQRGITIKSAVVSFAIEGVTVNLIDTPGHPDFIAEVERVLGVLDGAVLVVSAVEGVQSQTPLLMRALQRLSVPTLIFVNKIDRAGAGEEGVLAEIAKRLSPALAPLGSTEGLGSRGAAFRPWHGDDTAKLAEELAEHDDRILAAYVQDDGISAGRLRQALADQTKRCLVYPVFFGSAITGAGVDALMSGIAELLPAADGDADAPLSGRVFKVERGPSGEKVAYARLFTGMLQTRDRVRFGGDTEEKVTAIEVFDDGSAVRRPSVSAGEIGKLWGLSGVRIGNEIGQPQSAGVRRQFPPPTLESVVAPLEPDDGARLRVALAQLAEQDPLIDVRQDDRYQEISVSLYGEVQKEVIEATLAADYGLDVTFHETTMICVERPVRAGEAVEVLHAETNPFAATIGLRVAPAPVDSGIDFRLDVDARTVPLYSYKTLDRFAASMDQYVRHTLEEGLCGWQVTDCTVTMTRCGYQSPDGSAATRGPLSTPADFRKLTPLVLMQAIERARTAVCEPILRVRVELPTESIGAVLAAVGRLGAVGHPSTPDGEHTWIEAVLPATRVQELQLQLPALTAGEGVLESEFAGYQPVSGTPPTRRRLTPDPRNKDEYVMRLGRG